MPGGRPREEPLPRFLQKIKVAESGCHEWQALMHRDGYGKFCLNQKTIPAHRAAYLLLKGEIPEGMMVLHKCDNRKCVNPDHLYIGTAKDNCRDRRERCAWWGTMKYTASEIAKCKELYAAGLSQQKIGEILGMDQTTVSRFVRGKHLKRI